MGEGNGVTKTMTTDEALARIQALARPASVAEIGGFRPPDTPLTSWFGGNFVGLPGEEWPMGANELMVPLLQGRTDELPQVPEALEGIALFCVFYDISQRRRPLDSGDGWQIRTYNSLEGLEPLAAPTPGTRWPKTLPIRWQLATDDTPDWEDGWDLDAEAMTVINADDDGIELYGELPQYFTTKVGGWPSYIQSSLGWPPQEFVMQIASEQKPHWMLLDNGRLYLFRNPAGLWRLHLDFY